METFSRVIDPGHTILVFAVICVFYLTGGTREARFLHQGHFT
jgi:hypothetical protein